MLRLDLKLQNKLLTWGGIEEISIKYASEILREVMGAGEIIHLEGRHEVKHSIPTFQKSIDILGFKHQTNLKEGLIKMWDWAKQQPIRERFVWPTYELDKGIYSFWKV